MNKSTILIILFLTVLTVVVVYNSVMTNLIPQKLSGLYAHYNEDMSLKILSIMNDNTEKTLNVIDGKLSSINDKVELGTQQSISNAFSVVTENLKVVDEDAYLTKLQEIDSMDNLIEEGIDKIKFGEVSINNSIEDDKTILQRFNEMWYTSSMKVSDILARLKFVIDQWKYQYKLNYFNQISIPKIGYVICVPSSFVMMAQSYGLDIDVMELINYFSNNKELEEYAITQGDWLKQFVDNDKLYQITFMFVKGVNMFLEENYPDFNFELVWGYWEISKIIDYLKNSPLMGATYFISWVRENKKESGHMVLINKAIYGFNGELIGFEITDPFGNPNLSYKGSKGKDGKSVIVDAMTIDTVLKSKYDDGAGSDLMARKQRRVLAFLPKK